MSQSRPGRIKIFSSRRAAVEVQFNWIFILIAGAVILALFASIILKQKSVAEASSHATLLRTLSAIAIGSESAAGVTNILNLPEATIGFECNLIRIGSQSQQFQQMMLFAPSSLRTSPLLVQTREWSIPHRITNVVYFSSPKSRFIIIGDSPLARAINTSMPPAIEAELYPSLPPTLRMENADHTRFIFVGMPPQFPPNFIKAENKRISAVKLNGDAAGGTIEFYRKTGGGWGLSGTFPYLQQEMLIGAVFTDAPEEYSCIASNMLKKVDLVTSIYQHRTSGLSQTSSLARCSQLYEQAQAHFSVIRAAAAGLNDGTVHQANQARAGLEGINTQLQRQSCPLLY